MDSLSLNNAHLAKKHNLPSYNGFVDLVKAYDMVNHALLFDILECYGAPPKFVNAVEHIYQDLVVVLKIERETVELPQSVGVRQGDNMAPVLFLFLMSAFAETLEIEWKAAGIDVCTVHSIVGCRLALEEEKSEDIYQRNTCHEHSPRWKIFNVSMLMMEHSYSRHGPT